MAVTRPGAPSVIAACASLEELPRALCAVGYARGHRGGEPAWVRGGEWLTERQARALWEATAWGRGDRKTGRNKVTQRWMDRVLG